jgi:aminoglycoside/choline kinase family phosphotransferase
MCVVYNLYKDNLNNLIGHKTVFKKKHNILGLKNYTYKLKKSKSCLISTNMFFGQWFSPGTPASSTNKTDYLDITEILLKVVLNTITLHPHRDFLSH